MNWLIDPGDVDVSQSWWDTVTIGQIIMGIVALVAVILLAVKIAKAIASMRRSVLPVQHFLEDWNGEPDRPGVPGRKGVMARLAAMEEHLADAPTRREFSDMKQKVMQLEFELTAVRGLIPGVHTTTTISTVANPQHHEEG